ncbi:MAG: hypothetical protein R3E54_16995 [Halioglobus sp.]
MAVVRLLAGRCAPFWLCLLFAPFTALGSVVPDDEISLLNGAENFERYCTECHGWKPSEQYESLYGEDPIDEPDPLFAEKAVVAPDNTLPEPEPLDDWPKWAGPPPAEDDPAADVRLDVLSDLVSAIDDVYEEDADDSWRLTSDDPVEAADDALDALEDALSDDLDEEPELARAPGATDLTDPDNYLLGTSEADLYYHIANGTGSGMPGFLPRLGSEEAVWDLVNYIRSLWGEDLEE